MANPVVGSMHRVVFTDIVDVAGNPPPSSGVVDEIRIRAPDGTVTETTMVKDADDAYHYDLLLEMPGRYHWTLALSGAVVYTDQDFVDVDAAYVGDS